MFAQKNSQEYNKLEFCSVILTLATRKCRRRATCAKLNADDRRDLKFSAIRARRKAKSCELLVQKRTFLIDALVRACARLPLLRTASDSARVIRCARLQTAAAYGVAFLLAFFHLVFIAFQLLNDDY